MSAIERESPEQTLGFTPLEGVQVRLLIGERAFQPDYSVTPLDVEGKKEIDPSSYVLLNTVSVAERAEYWKKSPLSTLEEKKKKWSDEMANFFGSEKNKDMLQVLGQLQIPGENGVLDVSNFTPQTAESLYNRYFQSKETTEVQLSSGEKKRVSTNVQAFVNDIAQNYKDPEKRKQLEHDLPFIRRFAGMFGKQTAELIEQMIHLQVQVQESTFTFPPVLPTPSLVENSLLSFVENYYRVPPKKVYPLPPATTLPSQSPSPSSQPAVSPVTSVAEEPASAGHSDGFGDGEGTTVFQGEPTTPPQPHSETPRDAYTGDVVEQENQVAPQVEYQGKTGDNSGGGDPGPATGDGDPMDVTVVGPDDSNNEATLSFSGSDHGGDGDNDGDGGDGDGDGD